jgi:hypothetical protein
MSIYQGDGTRDDVPSVFIGVDEDRSDRLRVAFGIPCKTVASFECSDKGARELAQWLFDRGIQEAEFPSASTLRIPDERFPSGRPMIDIATEILQSLQARNGKRIGMEEVSVIHRCLGVFVSMPLGTRSSSMLPERKFCSPLGMIHRQAERWRSLWFARC